MRKKTVNTIKNSSKNATAGRYTQARGLVRMVRQGSIRFAPADLDPEPGFELIRVDSVGYRGYSTPGAQVLKIDLDGRVSPGSVVEVKAVNHVANRFTMEQLRPEKKKMKQVAAAIHEIYMEEHNEIEAFANYIPAHLRKQKK